MALPSFRSNRLLQAILQSRHNVRVQHPFHGQQLQRTLSSCPSRSNSGFSVSFGPETDEMIDSYMKATTTSSKSSKNASGSKSRARPSTRGATSTGSIEITMSDEDGDILATKDSATPKAIPAILDSEPPSAKLTNENTRSAGNGEDQMQNKKSRRARSEQKPSPNNQRPPPPIQQRNPIVRSEPWQIQKDALKKKFGSESWNPRKKLSPDAIQGLRDLHAEDPERYSTAILADRFKISPEAIRRILRSKWRATPEEMEDRRQRWARRHDRIWDHKAALGQRPARQKSKTPDGPEAFEEELRAKHMLGQI